MDEKTEFGRRLRDAMTSAGYPLRPVVLEREFNTRYWGRSVTLQGVRRWLRGEAIPSQDKLLVLADWLGVEPEVLRFGVAVRHQVQERRQRWDEGVGHVERETFDAFLSLPAPQRKIVREVILTFAKVHQAEPAGAERPAKAKASR
ncbi:transcriptional regulator [Hydrogenophaga sp. MI9]|uniref:transcriptional regulator n=1 Tax=Hydrogenophaga sp. MI9 TaxID=3453719 RepID=UPI003EEED2E6